MVADTNDELLKGDSLVQLVLKQPFVGWVYDLDYETVRVLTNDHWKAEAHGIPFNSFLLTTSFDPSKFSTAADDEREVILLRVVGAGALPHGNDIIRSKVNHFQAQKDVFENEDREFDDLTKSQIQWGALECRVLGTFYKDGDQLKLGSDVESFIAASRLRVFRPGHGALERIVNHTDPTAEAGAKEHLRQKFGITADVRRITLGTVKYTSSDRLHRGMTSDRVNVGMHPADFLARRSAVFGMTRTGKSNLVKVIITAVKGVADEARIKVGQLVYDLNGEYANANSQDEGSSIADVFPNDVLRYRMIAAPGFLDLRNNFYARISEAHTLIREAVRGSGDAGASDVKSFLATSFDEPDAQDRSLHNRWEVKRAIFQTLLRRAEYDTPANFLVKFCANNSVRGRVQAVNASCTKDPKNGLTLDEAVIWFLAARQANRDLAQGPLPSSGGGEWLDSDAVAMLNMLANKNEKDSYINGYKSLKLARDYHSPRRDDEVANEVYDHLRNGKIVILDLSVGEAHLRERISKQIADTLFARSMRTFTGQEQVVSGSTGNGSAAQEPRRPPAIVVFVEEAHNLLGRGMELTETWPRLAKEGAKFNIGLVYATQEVSSMHESILAATENWFVTHLNNDREVRELSKFYDFADFARSLIRAQDVGFARVKTLRSPFVVPTQIAKFDPAAIKAQLEQQSGVAIPPHAAAPTVRTPKLITMPPKRVE
jgi:hypothetical protein